MLYRFSAWLTAATLVTVTLGLAVTATGPVLAAEHADDAQHCISLRSIESTEVVSDHGILFRTRSGDIYLNKLPHRCPGLALEDAFMYRTSTGQLCDLDIISVLDDRGFGFTPGVSCGLGLFHPLTAEESEKLEAGESLEH